MGDSYLVHGRSFELGGGGWERFFGVWGKSVSNGSDDHENTSNAE